jgi:hypothetical protein
MHSVAISGGLFRFGRYVSKFSRVGCVFAVGWMAVNWPNWEGETAIVVASGPSAVDVPLEKAKGKARFLAIKDGLRLCPWADVLYACDHHWWEAHRGVLDYTGIRIAYDKRTLDKWRGIDFLQVEIKRHVQTLRFDKVGHVGWGWNSGFHAVNLAAQFGVSRIILVGFDMRVDLGRHFFGDHPYSNNPSDRNIARWGQHLDKQAPVLAERGIDVINCSPVSALTAFPKMSLEKALERASPVDIHRVRREGSRGVCSSAEFNTAQA